jgi:hypothetical protein
MDNSTIFILISCVLVFIALVHGSINDIKNRKAPKWIWKVVGLPAAISTSLWYISEFYKTDLTVVLPIIITSTVFALLAVIMAFKQGNGGDWRALFYVSILTPWVLPTVFLLSCGFGIIQILIDKFCKSKQKSAWMISITLGFVISCGYYIFVR